MHTGGLRSCTRHVTNERTEGFDRPCTFCETGVTASPNPFQTCLPDEHTSGAIPFDSCIRLPADAPFISSTLTIRLPVAAGRVLTSAYVRRVSMSEDETAR